MIDPLQRVIFVFSLLVMSGASGHACEIAPQQTALVAQVIDAVTFELEGGAILRLEGLGSPRPPARIGPDANWPIRDRARGYAAALVEGETIRFSPTQSPDRYGRIIAQVFLEDGTWANGVLVRAGMARVETRNDQTRCAGEALALEQTAREGARGMWELSAYAIRSPEESAALTNDYQIVEGIVLAVAEVRGRTYLNFGEDWRTDFTATIAPADLRRFEAAGFDLSPLAGTRIRVRGWLEFYNGPMIEVDHPEQIEILESPIFVENSIP